jgi:hypothetical protein
VVVQAHHPATYARRAVTGLFGAAVTLSGVGPADALSLAAPCGWNVEEERFSVPSDWDDAVYEDEATYPNIEEAWLDRQSNDFVSFRFGAETAKSFYWNLGLQHCPTGKGMLIFTTPETYRAMRDAFDAVMIDDKPWTMREIALHMRKLGTRVQMRSGGLGTCGCESAETKN